MEKRLFRTTTIRPILKEEEIRWISLLKEHHYLGFNGVLGERINYVAESNGEWVALLCWSSAALNIEARDKWLNWSYEEKLIRLKFVANNTRFLVLPHFRIPNLASHVLSLNLKRLSNDWMIKYKHPILLVETFVDSNRNKGTCYKADNWIQVGMTKGFSRGHASIHFHGEKKIILLKQLNANARDVLGNSYTNSILISPYKRSKIVITKNKMPLFQPKNLLKFCSTISDSRSNHGKRYQTAPLLAFCILAMFSGMNSYKKIHQWGKSLNEDQLADLKIWKNPSESAIRHFILSLDAASIDQKITNWYMGVESLNGVALAFDGKVLRGSHNGGKRPLQLLSLVTHADAIVVAQRKVEDKTNEIPVAQKMLSELDLKGAILTGDAMHTQTETAAIIVRDKEADYVFTVKNNQSKIKTEIEETLTASAFSPYAPSRNSNS